MDLHRLEPTSSFRLPAVLSGPSWEVGASWGENPLRCRISHGGDGRGLSDDVIQAERGGDNGAGRLIQHATIAARRPQWLAVSGEMRRSLARRRAYFHR